MNCLISSVMSFPVCFYHLPQVVSKLKHNSEFRQFCLKCWTLKGETSETRNTRTTRPVHSVGHMIPPSVHEHSDVCTVSLSLSRGMSWRTLTVLQRFIERFVFFPLCSIYSMDYFHIFKRNRLLHALMFVKSSFLHICIVSVTVWDTF